MDAAELVMRDLVDALIQENLCGFGEGVVEAGEYRVGRFRLRVRDGGALQRYRYTGGPVCHDGRPLTPAGLVELLDAEFPHRAQVCADLRDAVAHAEVLRSAGAPRPVDLRAGEHLAATRNRPFHPTARAVSGWTAAEVAEYGTARAEPLGLDWVAVRADRLRLGGGPGSAALPELLLGPADRERLARRLPPGFLALPVHPWQFDRVLPREFAAELAAGVVRPLARGLGRFHPTASLRTLIAADTPARHVKLPLGVTTLGATRLLPPRYLANSELAEATLRTVLDRDPALAALVLACDERTWCGWHAGPDDEFADRPGLLAAQVRHLPEEALTALALPMAALAANADLDSVFHRRPLAFFGELAALFLRVGLGFLRHGVLPELHGQNVLVVVRAGRPARLVLRDHDTLRVCPKWMAAAGIPEPGYRVKPGAPQSLRLEAPEALLGYLQTLGVQVNLYGIADALGRRYGVPERALWARVLAATTEALAELDPPDSVRDVVARHLLRAPVWPSRQVLGPLLRRGRGGGVSMPAGTGEVPNPLVEGARELAWLAARRRVLNAFLRETGRHDVPVGRLRLPGDVAVEVIHRSLTGQHDYGAALRPDGGRLGHRELVAALVEEVARRAPVPDAAGRVAELTGQIAHSVERSARYLRADRPAPADDPRALTRHAEQGVLLGHPFHPTPKSAEGLTGEDLERYAPELGASFVPHYVAVPPRLVTQRRVGPGPWVPAEVARHVPAGFAALPVHPWQARHLLDRPEVRALDLVPLGPLGAPVYPTSSVRTVCDPDFPTMWKLPLHVRVTNFVRNNPMEQLRRAADAAAVVDRLPLGREFPGFGVLRESGFRTLDPAVVGDALAAEFGVVYRANPFVADRRAPRVLAALLEEPPGGGPPELAGLVRDPVEWLRRYLDLSLLPLLIVFARYGVSFEAHVQNSLLCLDGGWPARFLVRDLEGVSVSERGAGDLPAGSPARYPDEEAWLRLRYHAVTNQLGHLVHVLGRYGTVPEGRLWTVAREAVAGCDAAGRYGRALLADETLPAKANLLSRFAGRGERPWYVDVPNPLREG
ncbi:Siderophore synthetase component [Amycolatopsis arida]|uniref:Siderophore synthetase component n=1 Tax=Amycolatopsis arida TaxID=587909 RepID=A0A1I5QXI2_9PSEU|nr:IucA/IucC family protein [Amycolatopsis arida]TDX99000.1 siderophore synthetase component [Amycolatopsis arida]SFP50962.1 Siderophore synthetase component [Amycolatopsis arida]